MINPHAFLNDPQTKSSTGIMFLLFPSGVNKFTGLTDEELTLYHGLNNTLEGEEESTPLLQLGDQPDSLDWVSQG